MVKTISKERLRATLVQRLGVKAEGDSGLLLLGSSDPRIAPGPHPFMPKPSRYLPAASRVFRYIFEISPSVLAATGSLCGSRWVPGGLGPLTWKCMSGLGLGARLPAPG